MAPIPKISTAESSQGCSQDLSPRGTPSCDPLRDPCGHSDTTQGMGSPPPSIYSGVSLSFPLPGPLRSPPEIGIRELLHKELAVLPTFCHLLHLLQPWQGG